MLVQLLHMSLAAQNAQGSQRQLAALMRWFGELGGSLLHGVEAKATTSRSTPIQMILTPGRDLASGDVRN